MTVTLTAPWQPQATLRYTVDGAAPTATSTEYRVPLELRQTTRLRTAGFEGGRRVTRLSEAFFARLGPVPPKPDIALGDLKAERVAGPGHSPSSKDHYFTPGSQAPQTNANNRGRPLRLRREVFVHGLGVHAPNQLVYELRPEFDRFVAPWWTDSPCNTAGAPGTLPQ